MFVYMFGHNAVHFILFLADKERHTPKKQNKTKTFRNQLS